MVFKAKFDSLEEMKEFAGFMAGRGGSPQAGAPTAATATAPAQPAAVPDPVGSAMPAQNAAAAMPAAQPVTAASSAQPAVPTSAPVYTLEDLGRAGVALQEAGKVNEVQALVASFGVTTLQELPAEQYGAFATALRSMGAPI